MRRGRTAVDAGERDEWTAEPDEPEEERQRAVTLSCRLTSRGMIHRVSCRRVCMLSAHVSECMSVPTLLYWQ